MKKAGRIIAFFAVLIVVFFVFVAIRYNIGMTGNVVYNQNCAADQTIFKVYSTANTHGELFSMGNYPYKICYSDIFNRSYNGQNPHNCTATNMVLRLSGATNAHAAISSYAQYTSPVCYGDLICNARTDGCNASLNEVFVVALSASNNAHISADPASSYGTKICCRRSVNIPTSASIVANITSPLRGDIYFANNSILFNQSSYGPNGYDNLSYVWDFGDGTTSTQSSLAHTYTTLGPKMITLKVSSTLNLSNTAIDVVEISIFGTGVNAYPLITNPEHLSTQTSKNIAFDGSESYVVNVTGSGSYTFECLGGNCPLSASGYCGSSCPVIANTLNKRGNYSDMLFAWLFGSYTTSQSGNGLVNGNVSYRYAGPNIITLALSSQGASASVTHNITIRSGGECINNGNNYWDNNTVYNMIGNNAIACDTGAVCCPAGYRCTQSRIFGSTYCKVQVCENEFYGNNQLITKCDDYNYVNASDKRSQCNTDCVMAKNTDPLLNQTKDNLTAGEILNDYKCVWNNNSCGFYSNVTKKKVTPGQTDTYNPWLTWTEVTNYGDCINGKQDITYCERNVTAITMSDAIVGGSCLSSLTKTIDCSSNKIELPFFGLIGVIQSIVIIFFVYTIFYKKRL